MNNNSQINIATNKLCIFTTNLGRMYTITKTLDLYIEETVGKNGRISAVEAAAVLDQLGILKDSSSSRGNRLRKLLRKGELAQAKQEGGFWYIYHSSHNNTCICDNTKQQKTITKGTKNTSKKSDHIQGLPPIVNDNSKILILGTMPGKESLAKQEYYASANNSFWYIMAEIFNNHTEFQDYNEKISCLINNNIALWDIIDSCDRNGSADKNIENAVYNDINSFLKNHPNIKYVIFNGKKAAKEINLDVDIDIKTAASTSNAYALSKDKKAEMWRNLLKDLK